MPSGVGVGQTTTLAAPDSSRRQGVLLISVPTVHQLRLPVPTRVVVLVSGSGTLLQAVLDAAAAPDYPARVVAVGADRPGIAGLARAERCRLPSFVVRLNQYPDRAGWDVALTEAVAAHHPDLVVSAGFGKILGPVFLVEPCSTDARLRAVTAACGGFVYAASLMGITGTRDTVSSDAAGLVKRVRQLYRSGGTAALHPDKPPGRPSAATAEFRKALADAVATDPRPLGYGFTTWSTGRLAAHLAKVTGTKFGPAQIRRLLHAENFSIHRPKHTLKGKRDEAAFRGVGQHKPIAAGVSYGQPVSAGLLRQKRRLCPGTEVKRLSG